MVGLELRAWVFRIVEAAKITAGSGRRLAVILSMNPATLNRWALDGPLPALEDFSRVLHWAGGDLRRADPDWVPDGELAEENQRLRQQLDAVTSQRDEANARVVMLTLQQLASLPPHEQEVIREKAQDTLHRMGWSDARIAALFGQESQPASARRRSSA